MARDLPMFEPQGLAAGGGGPHHGSVSPETIAMGGSVTPLLAPIDLQCVKASGVTFAVSAVERVIALLRDTARTATVSARTPLQVFTLDRRHFLPAVSGYQLSMVEADQLMRERLGTFDPASAPTPQ